MDGDQKDLDIGLTRLFKISHLHSVGDKLRLLPEHKPDIKNPDMVEALFGYVFEKDELGIRDEPHPTGRRRTTAPSQVARKGRIAFGFAKLAHPAGARIGPEVKAIMAGPRASFGSFYLRGSDKDWSEDSAMLAGRKRYFPRFDGPSALKELAESVQQALRQTLHATAGGDVQSRLKFLEPVTKGGELVFKGQIRLHNVLPEEIGAVLWTLTHGGDPAKPYRHMIGRAKSFGAGQVRVKSVRLSLDPHDNEARQSLKEPESWERPGAGGVEGWTDGAQSLAPFLMEFHEYMHGLFPGWPCPGNRENDILELLGVSSRPKEPPSCSREKPGYPELKRFRELRAARKSGPDRFCRLPPRL